MSTTGTQTKTFTVVDVRKVVDNFAADYSMIAQATGLRSMDSVTRTVSDLKIFAEQGYLIEVTIFLFDKTGNKIRAAVYSVSNSAIGWESQRPGNNLWPKADGNTLGVVATFSNEWWNLTDAEKEEKRTKLGLSSTWPRTTLDTSLSSLSSSAGQKYASSGYGWERTNYTN